MVIWRGWGILVIIITCVMVFLGGLLEGAIFGADSVDHAWITSIALVLSGVAIWFSGKSLNQNGNQHSLFFIPMQFWGSIAVVFAIVYPFL